MRTKTFLPTQRDLALLVELGEAGLMSTPMLIERHFRGLAKASDAERAFRRRLRVFQQLGLVESAVVAVQHRTGSSRLGIHTLTAAGAEFITAATGNCPRRPGTSLLLSPVTLPHRLGVIRTRLLFDDACRAAGIASMDWVHEYDLRRGADPKSPNQHKFVLYEAFERSGERLVCWPDAAARLRISGEEDHQLLVYLEYDRSTETAKQLAAKAKPFDLLVREHRYRGHWTDMTGQATVRVLFLCPSRERLVNAVEAIRSEPGAGLFRFATFADLHPPTLLTKPLWRTTAGGACRAILRSHQAAERPD